MIYNSLWEISSDTTKTTNGTLCFEEKKDITLSFSEPVFIENQNQLKALHGMYGKEKITLLSVVPSVNEICRGSENIRVGFTEFKIGICIMGAHISSLEEAWIEEILIQSDQFENLLGKDRKSCILKSSKAESSNFYGVAVFQAFDPITGIYNGAEISFNKTLCDHTYESNKFYVENKEILYIKPSVALGYSGMQVEYIKPLLHLFGLLSSQNILIDKLHVSVVGVDELCEVHWSNAYPLDESKKGTDSGLIQGITLNNFATLLTKWEILYPKIEKTIQAVARSRVNLNPEEDKNSLFCFEELYKILSLPQNKKINIATQEAITEAVKLFSSDVEIQNRVKNLLGSLKSVTFSTKVRNLLVKAKKDNLVLDFIDIDEWVKAIASARNSGAHALKENKDSYESFVISFSYSIIFTTILLQELDLNDPETVNNMTKKWDKLKTIKMLTSVKKQE